MCIGHFLQEAISNHRASQNQRPESLSSLTTKTMALRTLISKNVLPARNISILTARSFSNSPLPDEVLDMSINGLQISHIGAAIINHFKLGSSDPPLQPLGR